MNRWQAEYADDAAFIADLVALRAAYDPPADRVATAKARAERKRLRKQAWYAEKRERQR